MALKIKGFYIQTTVTFEPFKIQKKFTLKFYTINISFEGYEG